MATPASTANTTGATASATANATTPAATPTTTTATTPTAPGDHMGRITNKFGQWLKEVNVPNNATVVQGRGKSCNFTTMGTGALLFSGQSCTDSQCEHQHRPWPISGVLVLDSCAVVCEVCGLFREDFRINSSNLRRHVQQKHVIRSGETRDVNAGRLYTQVGHLRGPLHHPRRRVTAASAPAPAPTAPAPAPGSTATGPVVGTVPVVGAGPVVGALPVIDGVDSAALWSIVGGYFSFGGEEENEDEDEDEEDA